MLVDSLFIPTVYVGCMTAVSGILVVVEQLEYAKGRLTVPFKLLAVGLGPATLVFCVAAAVHGVWLAMKGVVPK